MRCQRLVARAVLDRRRLDVGHFHVAARILDLESRGLRHGNSHVHVRVVREPNRPPCISGSTVRTYTVLPSRRISSLISSSSFAEEAQALPSTLTSRPSAAAHREIAGAGFDHHPLDIRAGGVGRALGGVLAVLRVGGNDQGAGEEEGGGEGDFHGESFQTRWMSVGREAQEKGCASGSQASA